MFFLHAYTSLLGLDLTKIILEIINDNEKIILGKKVKFFDLHATKTLQHGFIFKYEKNKNFCFIGDEVLSPTNNKILQRNLI